MTWFRKLSIQSKLFFAIGLLTAVATIVTAGNIYRILQLNKHVHEMSQEVERLNMANEIRTLLFAQEIAAKNYLLTNEPIYQRQQSAYDPLLDQMLHRAFVQAEPKARRESIEGISRERMNFSDELTTLTAQETDGFAVGDLKLGEDLYAQVNNVALSSEIILADQLVEADRLATTAVATGLVTLLLFSLLIILAAVITTQVSEPVQHITQAITAFETDTYQPELLQPYHRRLDEVGKLTTSFDTMVQSIATAVAEKDRYLNSYARFVPLAYLDFLQKSDVVDLRLGDHVSAEMAVMFSDIRSFTTISEQMTPRENFEFVNDYLSRVSPLINDNNGFVVKYLGDGMMAIFPYNIENAIQAGIAKHQTINEYNAERLEKGEPPIHVGIGIHTGHMMVGMVGEEKRMQGDAFSDNVNLTSRIEGLTKFYGVSLLISEETLLRLANPDRYHLRYMGKAQVKGRHKPIALYEVFDGDLAEVKALKLATKETFEAGLHAYMNGQLDMALAHFQTVHEKFPDDQSTNFYLERTTQLIQSGLPAGWQGVEVMVKK